MKKHFLLSFAPAALLFWAVGLLPAVAAAGSCCGGGAAAALMLSKNARSMIDTSLELEKYDGFWTKDGDYLHDQPGTDLRQERLTIGAAWRISKRWQTSASLPFVRNINRYSGMSSRSEGAGDAVFSLWYEAFDTTFCRLGWSDLELKDLKPAVTFGLSLTVPTGISPYDDVHSSFDITGRGFYRLDGNMLLDKTIFPLSFSLFAGYGKYVERPVNREYGEYVEPYHKNLGDRASGVFAISYAQYVDFRESRKIVTYTLSSSEIWEGEGTINGDRDPTSGFRKTSFGGSVALSTLVRSWTVKLGWNHAVTKSGWGSNFPASDIYSFGVTHVFE